MRKFTFNKISKGGRPMRKFTFNKISISVFAVVALLAFSAVPGLAADKPNIVLLISDDTGWGDPGCYGGGEGRGMATPNIDQMAKEGMQFWNFYGQPSCTPGRAAIQTGRNPNRSGLTTVMMPGQSGGLPHAEWTLASVLKTAGYSTYFIGKWHLGEDESGMPINHGYDAMDNVTLYHLNAYTYADPTWHLNMAAEERAYYQKVTRGALTGKAGGKSKEANKILGKDIAGLDIINTDFALKYIRKHAKSKKPFFVSLNFAKNHQPSIAPPEFKGKSAAKSPYADGVVELDAHIGEILTELKKLGIDDNTIVIWTADNGAWQDVYPDSGYTPFRGTKGTLREGGSLVPCVAWGPGHIKADIESHAIVGSLDFMATFASYAGIDLPTKDREGKPMMFDSYDMTPLFTGEEDKWERNKWFYFSEDELSPGAIRVANLKAVYNIRGDDGQATGGLAVDTNIGWKGPEKYVATVPQVFDLWADPQERYDIFMNNYTESTWAIPTFAIETEKMVNTYKKYPPRSKESLTYTGPIKLSDYERYQHVKKRLEAGGFSFGDDAGKGAPKK